MVASKLEHSLKPWVSNQLRGAALPTQGDDTQFRNPSSQRQPLCDPIALAYRQRPGSVPHARSARRAPISDPAGDVAATPPNAAPDSDGLGCPADGYMAVPATLRNARDLCGSSCIEEFGVG
jgi:hypothetical protein